MDVSARSLLLELMSKSKKGLSFAEQLCSQARQELDACQGHSDEIEKIYSKLCFISRQIKVQVTVLSASHPPAHCCWNSGRSLFFLKKRNAAFERVTVSPAYQTLVCFLPIP